MADRRDVARGLMMLAFDVITLDHKLPDEARSYTYGLDDHPDGTRTYVVPAAIHPILCPSLSVLIDDEDAQVFVCAACGLAVDTGPQ